MPSTPHAPRLYSSSEEIRRIGEQLLDRSLPHADWTHEAHCAVTIYFMVERRDIALRSRLPEIIRAYNDAVGTANTDHSGYHETITQAYISTVEWYVRFASPHASLVEACNAFILSVLGRRDFLLKFYTAEKLFSKGARQTCVRPDLAPLDAPTLKAVFEIDLWTSPSRCGVNDNEALTRS